MKAEDYSVEMKEMAGTQIKVTTYRIGDRYHCHIANADPGATIVRVDGATRDEALNAAVAKAQQRLG